MSPTTGLRPTVNMVIEAVCAHYGIRRLDLVSQRRTREIVRQRQVAMYLAKRLTPASLPLIGRMLGGRDHTTIQHGERTISRLIDLDRGLRSDVVLLTASIGAVAATGRVAPGLEVDREPLAVAIEVVTTGAERISTADTLALASCLIGYARTAGHIRLDGEADVADPETAPVEVEVAVTDFDLLAAIDAVHRAYGAFATARFSAGERGALDALSKSLLGLFEARSAAKEA